MTEIAILTFCPLCPWLVHHRHDSSQLLNDNSGSWLSYQCGHVLLEHCATLCYSSMTLDDFTTSPQDSYKTTKSRVVGPGANGNIRTPNDVIMN